MRENSHQTAISGYIEGNALLYVSEKPRTGAGPRQRSLQQLGAVTRKPVCLYSSALWYQRHPNIQKSMSAFVVLK